MKKLITVYNTLHKDLTNAEMLIGLFSFLIAGFGVIYLSMQAWKLIIYVFEKIN